MVLISAIPTYFLTSQLKRIEVQTALTKLDFSLVDEDEGEPFFDCTLAAYNGHVVLYDFREIVEEYLEALGKASMELTINITENGSTSHYTTNAIYCAVEISVNAPEFLRTRFLSAVSAKMTYPGCSERLSYITQIGESRAQTWNIVYEKDGQIGVCKAVVDDYPSSYICHWHLDSSCAIASKLLCESVVGARVVSYAVNIGGRSFHYYVEDASPPLRFCFRNVFGVWEFLAFFGVTTAKTEASHTEALCDHRAVFYDRSVMKTYEVESGPLPTALTPCVEMLFMSTDVRLATSEDVGQCPRILIDDHTCEISDTDEEMNQVKFSYRFAADRPFAELGNVASAPQERVFSDEFAKEFS